MPTDEEATVTRRVDYLYNLIQELRTSAENESRRINEIVIDLHRVLTKSIECVETDSLSRIATLPDVDVDKHSQKSYSSWEEMYGPWHQGMTVDGVPIPRYGGTTLRDFRVDYSHIKQLAKEALVSRVN